MQTMYMRLDLYALTSKFVNYLGLKYFIETIWRLSVCQSVCIFDYLCTYPAYSVYICVPMGRYEGGGEDCLNGEVQQVWI